MRSKRVKRTFFGISTILLIVSTSYLLGWSDYLTVRNIEITGTSSQSIISRELAKNNLTLEVDMKLARVDVRAIERVSGDLEWLDTADVKRNWLDRSISIEVVEKIAVAKARDANSEIVNFDNQGKLFSPTSAIQLAQSLKVPLVTSNSNDQNQLLAAAKFLQDLPEESLPLIDALIGISITDSGFIFMQTKVVNREVVINWGTPSEIPQKSKVLQALIDLPENKKAKRFDLSQPDSPVVS
jgi:cell division septal protein FtsQ